MSKLTTRDYKNMAKRPSKRGHGRAVLRDVPEVTVDEALDIVDEAEQDLTELGEQEDNMEAEHEEIARVDAMDMDVVGKSYEQPQSLGSIDKGNALSE